MADDTTVNISTAPPGSVQWKPGDVRASLDQLLAYVDAEATKAIKWYWDNKKWKSLLSRWFRLWAVLLTATAGLLPVLAFILKESDRHIVDLTGTSGLWASALVGAAAALLGIDRAFGFSSGWARYVLAATEIRRRLEEFRLDWLAQMSAAADPPSAEQVAVLIQRAKEFRLAVESIVGQETKDWVSEFQNGIAQMEKDVRAQFDSLKLQVEKAQEARAAAAQTGSLELTVANADKAGTFSWQVRLEDAAGQAVREDTVAGSRSWACLNLGQGQYKLVVSAVAADGQPLASTTVVLVKPATVERLTVTLPVD